MTQTILETSRLVLRELTPGDLDFIAEMMAHPEVNRYYEKQFTREDSALWLDRQMARYKRDGHGFWLVVNRASADPIGQAGLLLQEVEGECCAEVGWLLHHPWWGFGYATEAAAGVRALARERWGYEEVVSLIRPTNAPSRRVAERIGLVPGRRVSFHGFEHIVYGTTQPGDHSDGRPSPSPLPDKKEGDDADLRPTSSGKE